MFYHFDTNIIHSIHIKNRKAHIIKDVWIEVYAKIKHHGETFNWHILDNKCSYDLKVAFKKSDVEYQLAPHMYITGM